MADDQALLRLPEVMRLTGYSRSSIYALAKLNKFPQSVTLAGGGAVAWRAHEVRVWIEAQGRVTA